MARTARVVWPNHPHHVILRGNNKRRLFSYPYDYRQFIFLMSRARRLTDVQIHAATLMTNHVHLVVTPSSAPALARFVKHVAQRYAQTRNARRAATGKLFEQRYRSHPIKDERQLAITLAYVELNPVRGGLVEHPELYPWSTCRSYFGTCVSEFASSLLTPTSWHESLGDTASARQMAYRDWVKSCSERGDRPTETPTRHVTSVESRAARELPERRPNGARAA